MNILYYTTEQDVNPLSKEDLQFWSILIKLIFKLIFNFILPFVIIWAINTLFKLNIEYNFTSWLSVVILRYVIK